MASLEDGVIYRIISPHYRGVLELNERTKAVSVQDFTASSLQLWKATKSGAYWRLENVSTGFYLGAHLQTTVSNTSPVIGTQTKFRWKVEPAGVSKFPTALKEVHSVLLTIPFLSHGLDALEEQSYPGPPAIFWKLGTPNLADNQKWLFDPSQIVFSTPLDSPDDRNFSDVEPVLPLAHGKVYKIVNAQSRTVAHLEDDSGEVRGYRYNEGRNQLWEAVCEDESEPYLWSFKCILNELYLGLHGDRANKGTLIAGSPNSFTWRLVVNPLDGNLVEFYAPYSGLSMNLDGNKKAPGTVMELWSPHRARFWKFEEVEIKDRSQPLWLKDTPGAGTTQ
ncbi:hypothetical protein FA15DRAFT_704791 [Coprinopsis marcescibilis]|uniref:Ricin B lectin domain-containing protein n=1 Tax=Coprinopsis marcescibilis TaxID=230819 RepID=A0A5C3KUY4_COPMA|nr:hypothetical protein FA15DRAFT_704791 [Coprinopsis marcescibilis]